MIVLTGAAIAFYYAVSAWSQVLVWPATEAPHYSHAWQVSIAIWIVVIIACIALRFLEIRYIRPRNIRIAHERFDDIIDAKTKDPEGDQEFVGGETTAELDDDKDVKSPELAGDVRVVVAEMSEAGSPTSERRQRDL